MEELVTEVVRKANISKDQLSRIKKFNSRKILYQLIIEGVSIKTASINQISLLVKDQAAWVL
jgi:hypothetical protein